MTRKSLHRGLIGLAGFFLSSMPLAAQAITADPQAIYETQPDGTKIQLHIRGDENLNWQEDLDGYTVVRENVNSGRYVYAKQGIDGNLAPTAYEVGKANPRAMEASGFLQRRELPSKEVQAQMRAYAPAEPTTEEKTMIQSNLLTPGPKTRKNLVVLVRFSDHVGRTIPSASDINIMLNAVGGDPVLAPAGSLRDFYLKNSYGALTINSTVVAWATVSKTEKYYADGNRGRSAKIREALIEALNIVDDVVDFNEFDQNNDGDVDALTFMHSGYAAEHGGTDVYGAYYMDRIWTHQWRLADYPSEAWQSADGVKAYTYNINSAIWGKSGSSISHIGGMAHEMGHILGLTDHYDYDSGGAGLGSWCLMANSWGGDGSEQPPPMLSAWNRIKMGWLTPVALSKTGHYTLKNSLDSDLVYKVTDGFPENEYLLIENRRRTNGSNKVVDNIPVSGDGLVIYHIDDNASYTTEGYPGQAGWPGNGNHYRVALLQADGQYHLEKAANVGDSGDAYRAGGVSSIGPATVPNTGSYQGGKVYATNHTISSISAAGANMEFNFDTTALKVTISGNGTVTSYPLGINCNINSSPCSANFKSGTNVTLYATPPFGYAFSGWSGACTGTGNCVVSMITEKSVNATFTPLYALSVTKSGSGTGTVTSNPSGINCDPTCDNDSNPYNPSGSYDGAPRCTAMFKSGTSVTLSATPSTGYTFSGWSGACTGTGSCIVSMTAKKSVNATFIVTPPPVAPSNLTATPVKSRKTTLNWKDNSSDENGFRIQRSRDRKTWTRIATTGANTTTYTDSNLPLGIKFFYRIRAYRGDVVSTYSNTVSTGP